ncbi:MAG: hypothetical protein AABW90_01285 [Nanoarchaeota archaeon]
MVLRVKRRNDGEYFFFVVGELKKGDYIGIKKEYIGISSQGYYAIDCIEAPKEIIILKNESVEEYGGLNSVIEQIKCETFEFKNYGFINQKARK